MKIVGLTKIFIVLTAATIFLASCEGPKILTLTNRTGKVITYETRPELPDFGKYVTGDSIPILAASKLYTIEPDSTAILFIRFTGLLFNLKIKEEDLTFDYLKLQTAKDTIVADNPTAIIKLISSPKTKFIRKLDKDYVRPVGKNVSAIVVR